MEQSPGEANSVTSFMGTQNSMRMLCNTSTIPLWFEGHPLLIGTKDMRN
jgi:hypothetical protein